MRRALENPWLRLAAAIALFLLVLWVLAGLMGVLTPFAVAFALAYFLNPAANALERVSDKALSRLPWLRRRLDPRTASVGVLAVVVVAVLVVFLVIVVPMVYHQVADAAARMPEYARVLKAKVDPLIDRLNIRYPEQMEQVRQRARTTVEENLPDILSPLTRVVRAAFSSALSFILTLLNLFVIPVFVAYLLYDMNRIREGMKELVPHRMRPYVYSRVGRIDVLLSAFARGQITVALMLGTFYGIALTACGVPMGLPVGFVIGLFNLIPFVSHVLGLPLALILSWVDDQSPTRLLVVTAVFIFGQFVEGNFVTPRVVGDSLGLHAVVIMLAVLAGGTLFGFVGMLVAVPVTAALSVFYEDLRALYLQSEFYQAGAPPPGTEATTAHADRDSLAAG